MFDHVVYISYLYLSWIALVVQALCLLRLAFRGRRLREPFQDLRKSLLFVAVVQVMEILIYGVLLWALIRDHPHGDVFLPPHSSFLLIQVATNTTALLAGWISSSVLFVVLWYVFIHRGSGLMLDVRDVLLLVLCAAVVGWPEVLPFFAIVFVLTLLWMFFMILRKRMTLQDRLVVSPVIIPSAVLTIIFRVQLLSITHLDKIRF